MDVPDPRPAFLAELQPAAKTMKIKIKMSRGMMCFFTDSFLLSRTIYKSRMLPLIRQYVKCCGIRSHRPRPAHPLLYFVVFFFFLFLLGLVLGISATDDERSLPAQVGMPHP
jgi:hypothetical protein